MLLTLLILAVMLAASIVVLSLPQFGQAPKGSRLERIKQSPNYKNGKFQNLSPTPQFREGVSVLQVMYRILTAHVDNKTPDKVLHFNKTNLKTLDPKEDALVWMGHSSYYLQTNGVKFLVDPVFSGYAAPFSFTTHAFKGADIYMADDIPQLDYLIITHDHWDHLDYHTIKKLFPKARHIITGVGTGQHLEYWGYHPQNIIELDWFEKANLVNNLTINCEPARHFSGRGLKRDRAIWASFMLQTPTQNIYLGGDSGYDTYFKKLGEKYDSVDLAILENGQYNEDWQYIHMLPGEQLQAMKDLKAKRILPVHNSKFSLAAHSWKEPMQKITDLNKDSLPITPQIGELVNWNNDHKMYNKWWQDIQ